ncbi:myosin phosphatase Rho-interacting protein-like isoform X2 [Acipenser ruthenus]|uniref:myosin phosphatase Rho-interacting protein-like isoform X2 n=1 Tax=Acipenser ruthenus TaxID=7906 RepID=UPI0027406353|nr:myosin phosphatase Rho-interacting protein-like isoform X2 [Acipenser ruthenus]
MSSKDNSCRKFQANIFNKSKCQNCFKPRESHLLNDEDLNKAKPIYGGWLLLAPEGTDFDNPMHRSRKWQRRFFILYEHGLLRYALDEMPSTLPQGTINMNQCSDVIDGESRTGQRSSLCILVPEKEYFIRAENKEIINGWRETLIVYPRSNKQSQKKKRKVEPPTPQMGSQTSMRLSSEEMNGCIEPSPAKVPVTSSSSVPDIHAVEQVPTSKSTLWQEEPRGRSTISCSRSASCLYQLSQPSSPQGAPTGTPKEDHRRVSADHVGGGQKARVESGYFSLEKIKPESRPPPPQQLQITSPTRYSYPNADTLTPCRSSEYCDPLLASHSPSPFSSQSSLDSEASSSTQNSGASWEARSHPARSTREYASLADIPKAKRISNRDAFQVEKKRLEQRTRARSPGREEVARIFGTERRRSQVIDQFETLDRENAERMETSSSSEPCSSSSSTSRQGRSERRSYPRKQERTLEASKEGSVPDVSAPPISPNRRARSLDRRATKSSMTPDLLNFKKGWMTKLYEDNQWKKHWFVLTDQSLRYYRDSIAEEAADLDGEIDLSTCHDVTEFPVQRNYGFQIHTKEKAFTLCAMTSGIRRNWIQAIMKHARPATAPDVTSSFPEEAKVHSAYQSTFAAGEIQESEVDGGSTEQRRSRARERRREGRSKTFDWAEFRPMQKASSPSTSDSAQISEATSKTPGNMTDLERERAQRREERRKRFESLNAAEEVTRMEVDRAPVSPETKPVQVEIEQRWHKVETMPLREEKQIPITTLLEEKQIPIATLREEKQIPIAMLHSSVPVVEPLPPQELAALLDKELGQTQRELSRLQQENHLLQEQLEESRSREHSAREGYVLQATCERGFAAMEETHQKVLEDIQRQHQREVGKLREEKERLLAEETAATIAAIEAMKNAHREELERTQRTEISGMSSDIEELRRQYQEDLQSIQRELEVLSEQYSQKCLENAHLVQALEAERQALRQCQRENQDLNAHNQELNNCLAAEITRLRSCHSGDGAGSPPLTQGKDVYELEVLLRVKESEIQYLKQEIHSLKDELQTALRDKKYTTDKYKDIYTELSIVKAKADCDITKLRDQLIAATEALGEKSAENSTVSGYDIMKSKSNPDFLKKERSSISRQIRSMRSKSVIEQVSWDS